jgi:type I restriction enzyme S subunit
MLLSAPAIKAEIGRRATGTSGSMKNISKFKLLSIQIPVPPFELQERFGHYTIVQQRALHGRRGGAKVADDLFNALVQRAFRGEL